MQKDHAEDANDAPSEQIMQQTREELQLAAIQIQRLTSELVS